MLDIEYQELYQKAEENRSWAILVPYPRLLFRYQRLHPEENVRIATVASHKLNHHKWCETTDKCFTIEQFLNKYGVKTI